MKHTEQGLLGMCQHNNQANSNQCQFYITTNSPLSFMDGKNVVFGRVVDGLRVFKMIEKETCLNERPNCVSTITEASVYRK